jgi:hypothetical protein
MGLLRRLRNRGQDRPRDDGLAHLAPELEARLPRHVLGEPLVHLSERFDTLDETHRWWFAPVIDALGLAPSDFSLAFAGHPGDERGIRATRFAGARPRDLQGLADLDAANDRMAAKGDPSVVLGGIRMRRGVAGKRSFEVADDGSLVPMDGGVVDPASVFHDLVRGDTWFHIFGLGDDRWIAAVAADLAGWASFPADGEVRLDLPDGWLCSTVPGGMDPAFAERIRERLAGLDDAGQERWAGILGRLAPDGSGRGFMTGTRLVAFDVSPAALRDRPASLNVWEYLTPYGSIDQELDLEHAAAAADESQAIVRAGRVPHSAGPAARITVTVAGDDGPTLVDRWLFRCGSLAYELSCVAGTSGGDRGPMFEAIAASFIPPG